jgi:MFS family permease
LLVNQIFGFPAPQTPLGWNLTPLRQQLISSLMTLGAFLGSSTAGFTAIKLGRKMCLWVACLLCVLSNVLMMATTNVGALYAGRLLIGVANGYFMTFSQLYIQETSPAKYRALLLTFFQFFVSFGTLIGTIVDWATAKRPGQSSYLIPLGLIYVVPVLITVGLFFIPESPRWLILQGRHEEGQKALRWLRPKDDKVELELLEIEKAIQHEKDLAGSVDFLDMFRDPIDRRRTFLSVSAVTLQAASGSMFIIGWFNSLGGFFSGLRCLMLTIAQRTRLTSSVWLVSRIRSE